MKLLFAILLTSLGTLSAQDPPELFKKANKAYEDGKLGMSQKMSTLNPAQKLCKKQESSSKNSFQKTPIIPKSPRPTIAPESPFFL